MSKKECLIIEPHSDDSCISSYGFLNKYREIYNYNFLLMFCSDVKLCHRNSIVTKQDRESEYKNYVRNLCGNYLGDIECFSPIDADTKSDSILYSELVGMVERAISMIKPDLMIIQGRSIHQDHENCYRACMTALRPCGKFYPNEILVAENPTQVHWDNTYKKLEPTTYCELSELEIDLKILTYKSCFPSQARSADNYLSNEGIKEFARYRGLESRRKYAEAFYQFSRII